MDIDKDMGVNADTSVDTDTGVDMDVNTDMEMNMNADEDTDTEMDTDVNATLQEKLMRLQWLLHRQHMKTHAASGPMADTSRGQGRILAFLRIKDGVSTKDLSYLLELRVSSLNELLTKLEKNGYITRKPSEADKRVILIYLTQKGKEEKEAKPEMGDVFDSFTDEDKIAFGSYLDRVIAALEAELETDGEQDGIFDWMQAARKRLGPEQFDQLMKISEEMKNLGRGSRVRRFWDGFGKVNFNGDFA
ncbi:MAG: MarR family transcriptional regulator, partial [Clostridiales Family XIII bacterium]|nr:MarR family transcriptional regulator [Clostridiales Family XIII bacterium]